VSRLMRSGPDTTGSVRRTRTSLVIPVSVTRSRNLAITTSADTAYYSQNIALAEVGQSTN
jgi:hypothetical protein